MSPKRSGTANECRLRRRVVRLRGRFLLAQKGDAAVVPYVERGFERGDGTGPCRPFPVGGVFPLLRVQGGALPPEGPLVLSAQLEVARWISQRSRKKTGIEIHPGAQIGRGLFIDHGMGVVIGETTQIGDNCTLYQGVTLGGTGKDHGKRHPTLGDNVLVGAGAKVLGPFTVGDNARVAAGAVVLDAVPPDATAVGVPARVVRIGGKRVQHPCDDMDQIHVADPVSMELCRLRGEMERLQKRLEALEGAPSQE